MTATYRPLPVGGRLGPRLPYKPLERFLALDNGDRLRHGQIAHRLDVDHAQLSRWKQDGIALAIADHLAADRLGVHPIAIWGDAYLDVADKPAPNASLAPEDVLAIYRAVGSHAAIARQYGVSVTTARNIRVGLKWAWLTGHGEPEEI